MSYAWTLQHYDKKHTMIHDQYRFPSGNVTTDTNDMDQRMAVGDNWMMVPWETHPIAGDNSMRETYI